MFIYYWYSDSAHIPRPPHRPTFLQPILLPSRHTHTHTHYRSVSHLFMSSLSLCRTSDFRTAGIKHSLVAFKSAKWLISGFLSPLKLLSHAARRTSFIWLWFAAKLFFFPVFKWISIHSLIPVPPYVTLNNLCEGSKGCVCVRFSSKQLWALIKQTVECISVRSFEEETRGIFVVREAQVCLVALLPGTVAAVSFWAVIKKHPHLPSSLAGQLRHWLGLHLVVSLLCAGMRTAELINTTWKIFRYVLYE